MNAYLLAILGVFDIMLIGVATRKLRESRW